MQQLIPTTTIYNAMQCSTMKYNAMQALLPTTTTISMMQCTVMHISTMQCNAGSFTHLYNALWCTVMQCSTMHVSQCAVHKIVVQCSSAGAKTLFSHHLSHFSSFSSHYDLPLHEVGDDCPKCWACFSEDILLPWKAGKCKEETMPSKMDVSDIDGLDGIGLDQQVRWRLDHL